MFSNDTIAAISSPPGRSRRGIIRISGPDAIRIARARFQSPSGAVDGLGRTRVSGHWSLDAHLQCPAVLYVFPAPHSFTREDVVELHLPGSPGLLACLMDALLALNVRAAMPGEFSARAYRNGAMDITAAEGIAAVIHAQTDGQLRAARRLCEGGLGREAAAVRETLLDLRALVEAALDFADEDIAFITPTELIERLNQSATGLRRTLAAGMRADRLAEPPWVVLAGPPNAGKSTLMNRLTGLDRSACSPLAGTTRDVLCAPLPLSHGEAWLCDTAGLLGSRPGNRLDRLAHDAALAAMRRAALVLWVCDIQQPQSPPKPAPAATLMVLNKCDTTTAGAAAAAIRQARTLHDGDVLAVSAMTGVSCPELLAYVEKQLGSSADDSPVVTLSGEWRDELRGSLTCMDRAIELARGADDALSEAELIAEELAAAAAGLARLAGGIPIEDVYDRVFSRFCIGK